MTDRHVSRREVLRAGLGGSIAALVSTAGCIESRSPYAPPVLDDRPEAVYVPPHFEGMRSIGTATDGPIAVTLSYSYPHRFWLLSGRDRSRVRIKPGDSIHLMLQVWVRDTAVPVSGTSPMMTVTSEGEEGQGGGDGEEEQGEGEEEREGKQVVGQRVLWPMLSQRMGFHYGDNLALDGEGTYEIAIEVPPTSDSLAAEFETRLETPARFGFSFDWRESVLDEISITTVETDRQGTPDALPPMEGGEAPLGRSQGPLEASAQSLPGQPLGTATTDEMGIAASLARERENGTLLRLTAETPYNRFRVPMLGPVVSVDGVRRRLRAALHPSLGMHYRGRLPETGSAGPIRISFPSPPQVARHEGYETAFMNLETVSFERP